MDKHKLILIAAENLLVERGVYGLSMKLLADRAGIAAGTIYRYFENKEALISELLQYLQKEAATALFEGWQLTLTEHEKYNLLWINAFNAVLKNPQRLTLVEMLCCISNSQCNHSALLVKENEIFSPMLKFYEQGIEKKIFHDWPVAALVTLSFDSSINLAKKTLKQRIEIDQQIIEQVRDASWLIIQKNNI